jgi:hypothetical protein
MIEITNDFELQMAENELKALMQQGTGINALRIAEIQLAINAYLLKR